MSRRLKFHISNLPTLLSSLQHLFALFSVLGSSTSLTFCFLRFLRFLRLLPLFKSKPPRVCFDPLPFVRLCVFHDPGFAPPMSLFFFRFQ